MRRLVYALLLVAGPCLAAEQPSDPVITKLGREWTNCAFGSFRTVRQQTPDKYQAAELALSRCNTERDAVITYTMDRFNDPAFSVQLVTQFRANLKRQMVQ